MTQSISAPLTVVNSNARIPTVSTLLNNPKVQTIEAVNRERLALLIKEAGSQRALSEKTGKSPAQISQWLNASKDSKSGKPRAMDSATRRELERKCGKPEGWMDQSVSGEIVAPAENAPSPAISLPPEYRQLLIDLEDLLPRERSKWIDSIHQAAEYAREIREHSRKTTPSPIAHALREKPRASASAKYGDGNERQQALPLAVVQDPFTAPPSERESKLYDSFKKAPR